MLKKDGTYADELRYFEKLWSTRQKGPIEHTPEIWDERAKDWIDDLSPEAGVGNIRAAGMLDRVAETAEYLRTRGQLKENHTVADVGCGPGLFVLEFAKTARRAVGIDYSKRFIDYGRSRAKVLERPNAVFEQRNFFTLDVEAENLVGAYDLVFTSITPAATGEGCMEKLIKMSRGWCYNASIVYASDSLSERVMRDVFGAELNPRWDGRGFYSLLNLLWLSGYYPETYYHDDERDETVVPSRRWAEKCASYCGRRSEEDIDRVERYLDGLGEIPRRSVFRYGSVLWDVNKKDRR